MPFRSHKAGGQEEEKVKRTRSYKAVIFFERPLTVIYF